MQRLEVLQKPLVRRRFFPSGSGLFSTQWRLYDALSAFFANVGLITETIDYELRYSSRRTHDNCLETDYNQACRWLTLVFTLISVLCLLQRHHAKLEWVQEREKQLKELGRPSLSPTRRFLSWGLFLELFILLLFPYPYLEGRVELIQHYRTSLGGAEYGDTILCYTGGEVLYFLMFCRLFFLLRSIFAIVQYQDALATEVCLPYQVKANIRFSVKCLFKMHPMTMILLLLVCSLMLIATILRLWERPFSDKSTMDLGHFETSLWCTAVTMATIGYGDYYPYTHFGRLICALTGAWGAVMFSVIVFVIQDGMDLTKRQYDCFQLIRKTRAAAGLVLAALRYNAAVRSLGPDNLYVRNMRKKMRESALEYRTEVQAMNKYSYRREEEIAEMKSQLLVVQTQLNSLGSKLDLLLSKGN